MSFDSLQEFLAMGGHGLYVWLSYGAAAIIVAYNVVSVRVAERRFFENARARERRQTRGSDGPVASSGGSRSGDGSRDAIGESTRS
ncbi:MAG TPA: heme exporter protein CcmD [Pseudomonadales bacterium]